MDNTFNIDTSQSNGPLDAYLANEAEQELARIKQALQWCKERNATLSFSANRTVWLDAPGFDTIIADTPEEAVQLAIELEKSMQPPVQEELPDWIPSAAELDELEESLQSGAQMARDESGAIQAQEINGAYFL